MSTALSDAPASAPVIPLFPPPAAPPGSVVLVIGVQPGVVPATDRQLRALVRDFTAAASALPGVHASVLAAPVHHPSAHRSSIHAAAPLALDREARTLTVHGRVIEVTRLEFELLAALARRPGRAFTRSALLAEVWDDTFGLGTGRTVDVHTFRLRRKLGPEGRHLVTVRGVGYRWDGPAL